jgi:hypothetical protein
VAARRLVIVMLVLLAVSTLAAAFLPPPHPDSTTTTETRRRGPRPKPVPVPPSGLLLASRMHLTARTPKTVRVELGDELRLSVAAPFGDDVEIPRLGLTAAVTPFAPAQFDLFAGELGSFGVRGVDSGLPGGRILMGRPGSRRCGVSRPEAPPGTASIPGCDRRGRPASRGRGRFARQP